MENSPRCLHCVNLITHEIGYSEWTITGSEFKCKVDCFKSWSLSDESQRDTETLKDIADKCLQYNPGDPEEHYIDCDIRDEGKCTCCNERC